MCKCNKPGSWFTGMPGQRCSIGSSKKLGQWKLIKTNKL